MDLVSARPALLELIARAAFAIDTGDADGWSRCFCIDGLLKTSRPITIKGRDALARFAHDWRADLDCVPRHMSWHHQFTVDSDDVIGRCVAAVLTTRSGVVAIEFTASYNDRYRLEDGVWKIFERYVDIDREPVGHSV